jgi:hypothetical protein
MNPRLLLPLVALVALDGCIWIRTPPRRASSKPSSHKASLARPDCPPSKYWDGERCRHKGKGKGARKHDD